MLLEITETWASWGDLPPEPLRQRWMNWFEHHGIDPCDVLVPGWIERDVERRRIRYSGIHTDKDGKLIWDKDGAFSYIAVVQLEAVPSPFPGFR